MTMICGHRYWTLTEPLEEFFQMLCDLGAELVFFTDGPPQEVKLKTWNKRLCEQYTQLLQLYDYLNLGWSLQDIINEPSMNNIRMVPELMVLTETCEKYGSLQVSVDRECDLELAKYATEHDALAVIGKVNIY